MAYLCFIILPDACFSYDTPCDLAFDPTFACCRGARKFGPAPPKRRASEARCKTPEVNLRRPPLVNLSRPSLARLALGAGHRQTRNGPGLALGRLSTVLDLEGAARPTWTTGHFARGPRSHPARRPHSKHPTRAGSCAIILAKSGHASLSERIV